MEKNLAAGMRKNDAIKHPQMDGQYGLKGTSTIVILDSVGVKERLEWVVHAEQLDATLKKYL